MKRAKPTQFRVKYSHCDQMGLVYHVNHLEYFEWARSDWLRQNLRSYAEIEAEGYYLVMTEANLKYLKPAHYEDILEVSVKPIYWGNSRIDFDYSIMRIDDNANICIGVTRHCFTNKGGKPISMPSDLKQLLTSKPSEC
ncbi:acyl-CoA thioesterase [Calditrichota bacterium]